MTSIGFSRRLDSLLRLCRKALALSRHWYSTRVTGINGVTTNGVKGDNSAVLDSLLGSIFHISNTGIFALAGEALSHDLRLDAAFFQSQSPPEEIAEVLDLFTNFYRFHPSLTSTMVTAAGAVGTIPSAYPGTLISKILAGTPLLASTAPFSSDHPSSGMLNGILANARHSMLKMLDKTLALVSVSKEWMKKIPNVSTTEEEVARCAAFQKQALMSCRMALENSRLANNAFMNSNGCAREEINRFESEIALLKNRVLSVETQYDQEIKQARPPQFAMFQNLGLSQPTDGTKIDEPKALRDSEIVKLRNQIVKRTQDLQTINQSMTNLGLWVELCERAGGYLGSIYNIITAIGYSNDTDAVAFKELMGIQWDQIHKEAKEVKSFLQPRQ
ncbi:hypothetical protein CI102_11727 [Trichoderma harzianum]|nr:hypothetical protein CI102_11727 [Trichoderma harzianum]